MHMPAPYPHAIYLIPQYFRRAPDIDPPLDLNFALRPQPLGLRASGGRPRVPARGARRGGGLPPDADIAVGVVVLIYVIASAGSPAGWATSVRVDVKSVFG